MEEVKEINGVDDDPMREGSVILNTSSDNSCDNAAAAATPAPAPINGRITGPTRRSKKGGGWTEEEDKILVVAVKKYNGKHWKKVASNFPHRTDVQCLHRWQKVLDPNLVKGPWTKQEDDLIVQLVEQQGKKKWSQIAMHLPGRIGKQCRERWHNHLNPDINRTPWTKEEELVLIEAHKLYGNKWAEIAKLLPGRTENALKNHWNCSLKKKLDLHIALGLDTNNDKTKVEGRKFEAAKQNLSITFSLGQKKESKCLQGTLSLDLTLGTANGRDSHLQPSSKERVERNDPMKLPSSFRPNNSCKTLDGNLVKFSLPQRLTEDPINLINLSTPRSPSDHLPPLLHMPFNVTASTKKISLHPREQAYLGTAKSPLKPQSNACSMNCLCADEGCKDAGTPQTVEYINLGFLCYQPLQIEDLRNYQAEGEFPSTDSYIRTTGSPVSYYTPPSHDGGNLSRCSSPESVLRSAARSFKYTPSIIRKRGSRTGSLIQTDGISTLEDNTDKSSNRPQSKQILFSPPKYRKLGTCTSNKSVEKRLEPAFDTVWDSNNTELPRVH